jgi:hypothetical protein
MGKSDEDVDIGPTHALIAMPEPERSQYCIDVVKALADAAESVAKKKGKIKQGKAAQAFMKDLKAKKDELMPVFFYIIKPQFRDTVLELMDRFSGYTEEKEQNEK